MHSSEPRRELGTRNLTEPVLSRTYLSLSSTHHATAPVAQWWSDSLVFRPEKAVGPGFNPRPGLQTHLNSAEPIPNSRFHASGTPRQIVDVKVAFSARRLLDAYAQDTSGETCKRSRGSSGADER